MTLTDCDAGLLELRTTLITYGAGASQSYDQPLTFYDLLGDMQLSSSTSCGELYLCEPSGQVFAVAFQGPGAVSEIVADVRLTTSAYLKDVPVVPSSVDSILLAMLGNVVGTDPQVFVGINPVAGKCPLDGWTFALQLVDGGPITAEVAYIVGASLLNTPPTDLRGVALFYNVDPTVAVFTVQATLDPLVEADAGLAPGTCVPDGGAYSQLTGQASLVPGSLTFFPISVL